ncbi:hypothetical protein SAMN02927937_02749 [Paenimyroides aquimaris]|uniref:Uncharacterized protein n=1 Tax=Paenimyroides marinum TaxID=1159016 RepID=A0A1H6MIZ5_9FLAO|nr:DUF6174 domain-containing protein [Paenimyroides aquimaris]SEI01608.1 hypothetical protein SAMN02927937_02749 [Paenimyroides aquimaris]
MKTRLLLSILFMANIMVSCDGEKPDVFYHFDEPTFTAQQKQWNEQNLKSYKFDQHYMSSATGPVEETITVQNGVAYSSNEDHQSVLIGTISDIYTRVLNDFNREKDQQDYEIYGITVDVKYNQEYHFPEEINFSTSYVESIDGGMWYDLKISNFEILEEE